MSDYIKMLAGNDREKYEYRQDWQIWALTFRVSAYQGLMSVELYYTEYEEDNEYEELFVYLTRSVPGECWNELYLQTQDYPGLPAWLEHIGAGKCTGKDYEEDGKTYPGFAFDEAFLRKADPNGFAQYLESAGK